MTSNHPCVVWIDQCEAEGHIEVRKTNGAEELNEVHSEAHSEITIVDKPEDGIHVVEPLAVAGHHSKANTRRSTNEYCQGIWG